MKIKQISDQAMTRLIFTESINSYICSSCSSDLDSVAIDNKIFMLGYSDDHIIIYSYEINDGLCCYCAEEM